MIRPLAIAIGVALAAMAGTAAPAQVQNNDKVLMVFGGDPCPAGTICVRAPESERYRIPKNLRQTAPAPNNERWADRARSIDNVGATGTGSCSNVGAGGWTGCWKRDMQQARQEKAAKAAEDAVPQP